MRRVVTLRVAVRVHARAARPRRRWDGKTLELWVTQPPVGGAANEAVILTVAAWAGVTRRDVRLIFGESGRHKVVALDGVASLPPADAPH